MEHNRTVGFEIRTLSNLIRREADNSGVKKLIDSITGTNGWIIRYLAENSDHDVFQRDIENEFSVRRSTVSTVLNLMEQKELIKKERVEYDARLKKITLTDKALELHNLACDNFKRIEKKLTDGISETELNSFFDTVDKMKKNLEQQP